MTEKNLTDENICIMTGLCRKSFQWIMNNGFVSEDALERLADAAGVAVKDIYLPDFSGDMENGIEFLKDQKRATVQFSQVRFKTRIKNLAKRFPDECEIVAENKDGSLLAHIPVEWVRINPGKKLSDDEKEKMALVARRNFS